ncbi:MAG: HAMP domain-containing sensor histidine kinase [Acidobacteriota bacterium]
MLILDLFEMARLESGTVTMRDERLDWAALTRHTIERYEPKFDRVGLTLIDSGCPTHAWVEADGRRMEQVLENLLINAVRYVPTGGTVWMSMAAQKTDEGDRFRLEVVDDGPGFPPSDLDKVFDRFYRGNLTESFPGSGLGLAIVKEIVERQGGTVEAANRRPAGAVLAISLPAAPPTS